MVGNCYTVCIFCIGGSLFSLLLKQYCAEHSLLLSAAVCASVFIASILLLESPLDEIRNILLLSADIPESYISVLLKSLGICCITHISSELCRDSGESAMGAAAELWGRCALIAVSIPVMRGFIELIGSIM